MLIVGDWAPAGAQRVATARAQAGTEEAEPEEAEPEEVEPGEIEPEEPSPLRPVPKRRPRNPQVQLVSFGRARAEDLRTFEVANFDRVIDVEGRFSDPAARTRCCGANGAVLLRLAQHRNFPSILREARQHLVALQDVMRERPAILGLRCRWGQHRSVGCCTLLQQCLARSGYDVRSRHLHIRPCGCPRSDCRNLRGVPDGHNTYLQWEAAGQEAAAIAQDIWQRLA